MVFEKSVQIPRGELRDLEIGEMHGKPIITSVGNFREWNEYVFIGDCITGLEHGQVKYKGLNLRELERKLSQTKDSPFRTLTLVEYGVQNGMTEAPRQLPSQKYAIEDDLDDYDKRIFSMERTLDRLERAMTLAEARHEESQTKLRVRSARYGNHSNQTQATQKGLKEPIIDDPVHLDEPSRAQLELIGLLGTTLTFIPNRNNNLQKIQWSQMALNALGMEYPFWLGHYAPELSEEAERSLGGVPAIVPVLIAHPPGAEMTTDVFPSEIPISAASLHGLGRNFVGYKLCFGYKSFGADASYIFLVLMPDDFIIYQATFKPILDNFQCFPKPEDLAGIKWVKQVAYENDAQKRAIQVAGTAGTELGKMAVGQCGFVVASGTAVFSASALLSVGVVALAGAAGCALAIQVVSAAKEKCRLISMVPK